MENETIVQITSVGNDIYGLTSSGGLAYFDKNAGMFVLKCTGDVLTIAGASAIKKIATHVPKAPVGKYGNHAPVEEKKKPAKSDAFILAWGTVAILIAAALIAFFLR